jgi:hypothetical protein
MRRDADHTLQSAAKLAGVGTLSADVIALDRIRGGVGLHPGNKTHSEAFRR